MTVDPGLAPREDTCYGDPKPEPVRKRRRTRPSMSGFREAVLTQPCILGPVDCQGRLEAHHVITQQKLRRIGADYWLADPRNGMALCERHHRRHTLGYERIPFSALSQEAVDFADDLGLRWYLERFYPVICPHCAQVIINKGAHAERCSG